MTQWVNAKLTGQKPEKTFDRGNVHEKLMTEAMSMKTL